MNRNRLVAIVIGITILIGLLDYITSAELIGSVLFTIPLVLCLMQRSKWLLWGTTCTATLLTLAAGIWSFHRIALVNPWVASVNGGLLIASLLTLATLIHLWINQSHKLMLESADLERRNQSLTGSNEQLEHEMTKIKASTKVRCKPLLVTIKQYQAFVGQLSDLHRTMVVTAMCSGVRVSEVLALRWDQLDFAAGLIHGQRGLVKGGPLESWAEAGRDEIRMDPVLTEALLEWRSKNPGSGLVFPSHITGRCYHAGPIQQDYFRPTARKLGLVGVCWHTFPNSYSSWLNEDGVAASAVQQKLLRHADSSTVMNIRVNGSLKPKAKSKRDTNGKTARRVLPTVGFRAGGSRDPYPNDSRSQPE